jgi:ribosomal protein S18 acetylase RimI-like enzyme
MQIRTYELSDIELIAPLFDDFISLNKSLSYKENSQDIYLTWLKNIHEEDSFTVLVVEENAAIVGFAVGMVQQNKPLYLPETIGNIGMLIIDSKYRRKCFGTLLYNRLCDWFKSKDVGEIQLTTETNNEIAKRFWESFGFNTNFEQRSKKL